MFKLVEPTGTLLFKEHPFVWSYSLHIPTGRFIRHTLLVPDWPLFCLQKWLSSLWHKFIKVQTIFRDFSPYWHDGITQSLQICWLHIHVPMISRSSTLPRCSIWLRSSDCGGPFVYSELIVMLRHVDLSVIFFQLCVWHLTQKLQHKMGTDARVVRNVGFYFKWLNKLR